VAPSVVRTALLTDANNRSKQTPRLSKNTVSQIHNHGKRECSKYKALAHNSRDIKNNRLSLSFLRKNNDYASALRGAQRFSRFPVRISFPDPHLLALKRKILPLFFSRKQISSIARREITLFAKKVGSDAARRRKGPIRSCTCKTQGGGGLRNAKLPAAGLEQESETAPNLVMPVSFSRAVGFRSTRYVIA